MKKTRLLFLSLCLTGCMMPQYGQASTTVSEIQGGCFSSRENFLDQAACIQSNISGSALNPYAQEYLAHLQSLIEQVKKGKLSGSDARLRLTKALNELRQKQQAEFQQQEASDSQQRMQEFEMLKPNSTIPLVLQPTAPRLRTPVTTNCNANGDRINCTSY